MAAMDLASGAPFQSPAAGESPAQKQETIMGNCALCGEPMPAGEEMFNYPVLWRKRHKPNGKWRPTSGQE